MADLKVDTQDFDYSEYDKNCFNRGNGGGGGKMYLAL